MSERNKLRPVKLQVRCAIYTRKSTEDGLEQEFNSLDAQREAAEAYIRSQAHEGWTIYPVNYDDGGFTGGNMERPALQRLMADIEAGQIDCVVVHRVDRLSRGLLDFTRMIELFDKKKIAFVSVTQAFNTASSMGRLVLNVLLSFAQFEREIISERIRDKIAATRRKGKWTGGQPPLGYDVRTQPLRIEVNPEEAEQVREIYRLYLDRGGLIPVVEELDRRGWTTKPWVTRKGVPQGGKPYTKNRLAALLSSVLYSGRQKYKEEVHAGEHQAIVAPEVWQAVQDQLKRNRNVENRQSRSNTLLAGLLRCQPCGTAMSPSCCVKGARRYCYYTCTTAQKRGWSNCPSKSVPAAEIERFVLDRLELPGPGRVAQVRELVQRIDYDGTTGKLSIYRKGADSHE